MKSAGVLSQVKLLKTLSLHVAFVLLVLVSILIQHQLSNRSTSNASAAEDLKYLPSGKFLKGAALCYDELAADLLWIKAIAYFGGHAKTDRDYTWLYHLIDITTTLDPLFLAPYEFGGIVLTTELNDVDKSISILKKGMENVPQQHKRYWYLPFFLAFDYMYYKGDNLAAARFLEVAARFPQRPDYLPLLVSRLYANTDDPTTAIPFLEEMISSTDSVELQNKLQTRIKEMIVERDIRLLEKARDQFRALNGRYPLSLDELVRAGTIKKVPAEPFRGRYYIDTDDYAVYSSLTERLKVHFNKKSAPPITMKER